ncbi:Glutaredoxin family protein, putative [Theobroma cacao]|uniref:Glutaredoxin family protein, putative n=1 Tax=Theobroma cacao TaxID=3641 RepID=A0A061EVS2_THECC|nr:Glutaredoxin family protein, putative [Theobroma cacao]
MKGMKGRFLKKLKFIPTISTLKQGLVLQLNPQHTFANQNCHSLSVYKEQDCKSNVDLPESVVDLKDQKDEETELEFEVGDQDSITPSTEFKDIVTSKDNSQLPISSEIIVKDDSIPEGKVDSEEHPSLIDFEEKCPPGGEESVIFYTTSLRGIRKTFEDCSSIRFLLDSFKILVHERDVSMDKEFREELWRILGGRVIPPKLFIKGRYIGGADEVVGLHEQGKLKKLLEGIPSGVPNCLCTGCANMRFLVCSNCNGSRKVYAEKEGDELCMKCPDCNENGLINCPVCC